MCNRLLPGFLMSHNVYFTTIQYYTARRLSICTYTANAYKRIRIIPIMIQYFFPQPLRSTVQNSYISLRNDFRFERICSYFSRGTLGKLWSLQHFRGATPVKYLITTLLEPIFPWNLAIFRVFTGVFFIALPCPLETVSDYAHTTSDSNQAKYVTCTHSYRPNKNRTLEKR